MHYLMYIIAAISIGIIPVLESSNNIAIAIAVAALSVAIGQYFQYRRSSSEVQTLKAQKQNDETEIPMDSAAGTGPESENQDTNEHQEMISTIATSAVGILDLQLLLLPHIKDPEKNHFVIGYLFGLVDGILQLRGIDINDEIASEVMCLVLELKYSDSQFKEVLDIYAEEKKNQNSLVYQGMCAGGEDVINRSNHGTDILGLLNYFGPMPDKPSDEAPNEPSNEVHDEPSDDEVPDETSDEVHGEPSDDEATIEKRLERLAALHRDGLITKKVLEEKQAEIVSKI